MADLVLSPLVDAVIGSLLSGLIEKGRMIYQVGDDLETLSNTLSGIRVLLEDAEARQITDKAVKKWLGELKDIAYDADDVLEEIVYEALRRQSEGESNKGERKKLHSFFPSCSCFGLKQVPFKLNMAERIKDINERIEKIHTARGRLTLKEGDGTRASEHIDQRRLTASLLTVPENEILGRDKDGDEIIKWLLSNDSCGKQDVSVISIVGMGGLGKTTLAQRVYNDQNVKNYFDMRAWVCVSEDFDILRLTGEIINSATGKMDSSALDRMQCNLRDILSGKRFLIVLDDVWNERRSAWDKLRAPFSAGAKGSKIMVTTRGDAVSKAMTTDYPYRLEHLGDEDCLLLFVRHAFEGENSDAHPELLKIGEELVKKRCQGLPLAVKALGSLLSSKRERSFWKNILYSPIWSSMEDKSEVTTAMRVSYHHLPPNIKQCFAFCSIFPKDYYFGKDELVKMWMAQGFIQRKGGMTLEETGSEDFHFLLSRSFFQREGDSRRYKMHDCIHDLAESISSEECLRIERGKPTHIPQKGHRHSSFIIMDEHTETVNLEDLYKCKGLRTFILQRALWKNSVDNQVVSDLIVNFRCLRVLDLSRSKMITELPADSICSLKHLRYLDLSFTNITQLPESVSSLYNLQTLKLKYCSQLRQLPKETRKLLNLRHLNLDGCSSLEGMPSKIGGLTCLQTLSRFLVGRENGSTIGELKGLTELRGAISIAELHNVSDAKEVEKANLKKKAFIGQLEFSWGGEEVAEKNSQDQASSEEELEKILEALQPHPDIKGLSIIGYRGNNYPSWLQDSMLPSLKSFSLEGCTNFNVLPPLGQFHILETLYVCNMCGVKCMGREFYGDEGTNRFPLLKVLDISDMPNLKEWCEVEGGEFPCLEYILIYDCPKLMKMPSFFSTVTVLNLAKCPQLGCLPRLPSLDALSLDGCNEILLRHVSDLTSLSYLRIKCFSELRSLPEEMLRSLGNLKNLMIIECPKLVCLVEEDKGLPLTLTSLEISGCDNLKSLPKGLQSLTYLKKIMIYECPKLFSLPEEGLPSTLEYLDICSCKKLWERYRKEGGEDWAKISHIPRVEISR